MILHLTPPSRVSACAIFDPAAVPATVPADVEAAFELVLAENQRGNIVLYASGTRAASPFRVYVDEDPDPTLRLRAAHVARGGLCRFPSGHIVISGMDYFQGWDKLFDAGDACGQLPAGKYVVEGFDVAWEPGRIKRELQSRVGRAGYNLRGTLQVITGGGCMGLVAALVFVMIGALGGFIVAGVVAVAIFLALIGGSLLLDMLPIVKRVDAAERELRIQFPSVVLVLRRLPDDIDVSHLQGLAFGPVHVRRERAKGFEVIIPPSMENSGG